MKLYDDIKDKEPQTRMILDLQKVRRFISLVSDVREVSRYVP